MRSLAVLSAVALSAGLLAGCSHLPLLDRMAGPSVSPRAEVPPVIAADPHSYANPQAARVTHVALDLAADFDARTLSGTATLDLRVQPGARELVVDTNGLDIRSVTVDGRPAEFHKDAADRILGQALHIVLPAGGARRAVIAYSSAPSAGALQWLTPAQTVGKRRPYLLSQGEAILTRSWIPTQDSPGIRQTWEARITAPADLRVLMSAEKLTPEGEAAGSGRKAWRFRMERPVAPYLIAIGIGDIAFQATGPRTGVYTEPQNLAADAREFEDTERMVQATERLYGPYRWGRYDLLILPPSFPYGGQENPTLTFATPTVVAGDKSLVSLVSHELAHSWSGNLVTNATWADFWLNEGFTDYLTGRITEEVYGKDRADMERVLSYRELTDYLAENHGPDTALYANWTGRDPDDVPSEIAYNKGALFLETVESLVGRRRFDTWLRGYFDRHAFQPITTALFLEDIRANLVAGDADLERRLMLDAWVFQPGLPSNVAVPTSPALARVDAEAARFAAGAVMASGTGWSGWSTQERQRFLGQLPRRLDAAKLADLQATYGLNAIGNAEVRFAWLTLAVANRYDPAVGSLEQFLTSMGRRKFVAPLFRGLMAEGDWGRPIARRLYAEARPGYHPVTTGTVDTIVR